VEELFYRLLAEHVGRYLESVDRLASARRAPLAGEAHRLVAAWRALLELHGPGRCGCRRGMCSVWRVASAYFVRRP
jgi:hypothetical protein